jgi:putative alpha-1,2-mannosidase
MYEFQFRCFKYIKCVIIFLLLIGCGQNYTKVERQKKRVKVADLVDPFLGTGGHGHTFPGATRPFGMVHLSPDNGTEGWDWSSGYHYSDSTIVGFSHTHLSGTGIGDYLDISIMPFYGDTATLVHSNTFSHNQERAHPGYYEVSLKNGLHVALTATDRVGLHQYTYHTDSVQNIAIDLGFAINWDKPTETEITVQNDTLITGYRKSTGWAKQQWVYFAAVVNRPIKAYVLENATINLDSGKTFQITTKNNSLDNKFVQEVYLNNKPLHRTYITHQELIAGGTLHFVMGNKPNKSWGVSVENYPPSMTEAMK